MANLIYSVGSSMLRWSLISAFLVLPYASLAADFVLNDLKTQNGIQLSTDELKQLLPNAKVVSYLKESTRRWSNKPNGKFVASSDVRRHKGMQGKSSTAQGTWHIGDNGTYCVTLEWPKRSESWCRYIYKVGDKFYGVKSISDGATTAHEIEFSK